MSNRAKPGRWVLTSLLVAVAVAALALPTGASHWAQLGWRDYHIGYRRQPSGYNDIVQVFGQPCSSRAQAISLSWRAADTGQWYTIRFHKELGGYPTTMVSNQGGLSTNLDNDVYGHIQNAHLAPYVRHGIYGYLCRYISGTTKWSTHAWGIAVDVSSADEYNGKCRSDYNRHHASIWQNHRWVWGLSWCDPMHFQYARNY